MILSKWIAALLQMEKFLLFTSPAKPIAFFYFASFMLDGSLSALESYVFQTESYDMNCFSRNENTEIHSNDNK